MVVLDIFSGIVRKWEEPNKRWGKCRKWWNETVRVSGADWCLRGSEPFSAAGWSRLKPSISQLLHRPGVISIKSRSINLTVGLRRRCSTPSLTISNYCNLPATHFSEATLPCKDLLSPRYWSCSSMWFHICESVRDSEQVAHGHRWLCSLIFTFLFCLESIPRV